MTNPGTFKKGDKRPGQGKRGPNKTTLEAKEMILEALNGVGGVEYLMARANDPKTAAAFMSLIGRVVPIKAEHSGPNGESLVLNIYGVAAGKRGDT